MYGFWIGFSPTLDLEAEHQETGKISTNKSDLPPTLSVEPIQPKSQVSTLTSMFNPYL